MRRVLGGLNLADHVTKGKTWREIDELMRGVGGRLKVIQSGKSVGNDGAGWRGSSEFTVDSEFQVAQGSEAAQCSCSQVSVAPCGRSDGASERYRIGIDSCSGLSSSSDVRCSRECV